MERHNGLEPSVFCLGSRRVAFTPVPQTDRYSITRHLPVNNRAGVVHGRSIAGQLTSLGEGMSPGKHTTGPVRPIRLPNNRKESVGAICESPRGGYYVPTLIQTPNPTGNLKTRCNPQRSTSRNPRVRRTVHGQTDLLLAGPDD